MLVFWWVRRYGRRQSTMAPPTRSNTEERTTRRQAGHRGGGGGGGGRACWKACLRKYVVACVVCGGLSVSHGVVFVVLYLLLRSYTTSMQFFETIPTYVPGVVFIITGLILMCFAKRKNRYTFLLKMGGGCCVVSALLCVVVTVTTTVVHMNRLQTLHECVYTPASRTCMCVSGEHATPSSEGGAHRFVFHQTPNCEVVHGSLYACLRALFSFSVLGVLLCIACSMLVYQLATHERKRVYWEQLEVRRRFLYQRHSHHSVCGCYDDLYPWQLWEMLDYRFLSHEDDANECPPSNPTPERTITSRRRTNSNRSSRWDWLPWARNRSGRSNNHNQQEAAESDPATHRQNFMNRLMSRNGENQVTTPSGADENFGDSMGSLPWRSECIHIFRPRDRHCFPPMRFGMRSRSSPYGRPHHANHHRRTRSNDGVFHHLHMSPRYGHPYPMVDAFAEIPRYMWGPPPPYSQPPSVENLALYERTQPSRRTGMSGLEGCNQVLSALEIEQNGSVSSKMSTPMSERRFVCHNFTSDGITLTIGGDYEDGVPQEHKKEDTCIVEVHVPYILQHKRDVFFNTLPARSCRRSPSPNPFKSLSNIPLGLLGRTDQQLSVIEACCDADEERDSNATPVGTVVSQSKGLRSLSSQLFGDGIPSLGSLETDSYHTMVEAPSEFKSSLVISNTIPHQTKFHAQSMPNLNLSNSCSLPRRIRRAPSSGNTSTSQDFADFDLEDDNSPFILCSPVSDLPSDNSSSSYPRFDHPFSESDSSSCGAMVVGSSDDKVVSCRRPTSDCPVGCTIRHLHRYHPDSKIEVRGLPKEHAFDMSRDNNFVVTIKGVNV